jgi:hypothetical protein
MIGVTLRTANAPAPSILAGAPIWCRLVLITGRSETSGASHFVERTRASEAGCRQLDAGQSGFALQPARRAFRFPKDLAETTSLLTNPLLRARGRAAAGTARRQDDRRHAVRCESADERAPGRPGTVRPPVKASRPARRFKAP